MARWSYNVPFSAAMAGAALYFARRADWAAAKLPGVHKYEQFLRICGLVLGIGFAQTHARARRAV
ncbi:hypothetical protein ACEWPL_002800 [Roseovarius sp. S1116L3]|uniref:hypothetical protein n=1 Tax=Roseovarius roseus TaxID=3342636 RepID=UPI00372AEE60